MAEITRILAKLLERTKENKVGWLPTANEHTFTANIGDTSVIIEKYRGDTTLRILDESGREIDVLHGGSAFTSSDEDIEMNELYDSARRIALSVDTKLENLLKELG